MHYDNTLIYGRSMELVAFSARLIRRLPRGYGFLADQWRRAVSSVPLCFAEGYGKSTAKDQRRFFVVARGSVNEVAAILDVALGFGVVDSETHAQGKELCDHLARMLTRFRRLS